MEQGKGQGTAGAALLRLQPQTCVQVRKVGLVAVSSADGSI